MNLYSQKSRRVGRRASGSARAFTLVELLVVISIIALLISILLPSLKCARESSNSGKCLAHLKGIAMASIVYAFEDSTEACVPVHGLMFQASVDQSMRLKIGRYAWGGKSGRGPDGSSLDRFFWGTGRGKGPAHRPMNIYLYKDGFNDYANNPGPAASNWFKDEKLKLGLFRCPKDSGYAGEGYQYQEFIDSGLSAFDHYGSSYAAGGIFIFGGVDSGCPGEQGGTCCSSLSAFLRPLSRIPNPSNTIYYEEIVGRLAFTAAPLGFEEDCGTPQEGVVNGWHKCRGEKGEGGWLFNVSFVDAHASVVRMKGFENPRQPDYPECPPGYDEEACYGYWHCVIVRGKGFQKDVLPSPPVKTNVPCG